MRSPPDSTIGATSCSRISTGRSRNGLVVLSPRRSARRSRIRGCRTSCCTRRRSSRDNRAIGRSVAATERARRRSRPRHGPLLDITRDDTRSVTVPDATRSPWSRPGTRYVLCVLKPSGDLPVNAGELARALAALTVESTQPPCRRATISPSRASPAMAPELVGGRRSTLPPRVRR